jgi:hypothetical protein
VPYKDPEKQRECHRKWREANRERQRAYDKAYLAANREKRTAQNKAWYEENKGRADATDKAWREANPDKTRASCARHRSRKLSARPSWVSPESMMIDCPTDHHLDHIHPLAGALYQGDDPAWKDKRITCGLDVPWNVWPMLASDNCSKGTKLDLGLLDWWDHSDAYRPQ